MVLVDTSLTMVMSEWFTKFLSATFEGGHKILSTATVPNLIEGHRPNGEVLWFCDNTYVFPGSAIHCVTITLHQKFFFYMFFSLQQYLNITKPLAFDSNLSENLI